MSWYIIVIIIIRNIELHHGLQGPCVNEFTQRISLPRLVKELSKCTAVLHQYLNL